MEESNLHITLQLIEKETDGNPEIQTEQSNLTSANLNYQEAQTTESDCQSDASFAFTSMSVLSPEMSRSPSPNLRNLKRKGSVAKAEKEKKFTRHTYL